VVAYDIDDGDLAPEVRQTIAEAAAQVQECGGSGSSKAGGTPDHYRAASPFQRLAVANMM
jgi:hypothetical protein